ncbi:MAG: MupA/Atu3671 family FMN-dependent luciferase-like monooxygenase, partial [Bacteroidota bacterium]
RNLVNFIEGMDEPTLLQKGDHLLAITSMSFDISILELIYPICRGVLVSVKPTETDYTGFDIYAAGQQKSIDYSLMIFSSQKADGADKYKLLFDTVRYADDNDFQAVWLPERHFHEFGGIFPNPSVLGASLASTTKQIHIRSGSVVLPLHDSIRVAEEWSVVDNISNGRIGLSIASGWHSNDFVFRPDNFEKRHQSMFAQIEELRNLWKGESIQRTNGVGEEISLRIFPQPIQKELPLWVTSGGNIATFQKAGAIGANVLTHMLGQDIEHLKTNIEAYKTSLRENGFDPAEAKITLMVHTYVGESLEQVKEAVREPFIAYLKSSLGLIKNMLKEFSDDIDNISSEDLDNLLDLAFERYWQTAALFGTEESCREMADILRLIGVTEIACLIDFGLDHESIVKGLEPLNELRKYYQQQSVTKQTNLPPINALQITPSYLKMLSEDAYSQDFLSSLRHLMVGGEAFPQSLADGLSSKTKARISNMYGPTETTIWSSTQAVTKGESITVGKPIQATQFYVLDAQLHLCPLGAIGELYIGGAGVARGYLDRPELTKERFVSNPFDSSLGKIYKTGDLAKWLPDGRIQLLGRADNQVKINGHRIELEEVENVLLQLPQVSNVAVMVQQDEQDNRSLVAYIVTQDSVQSKDLRQFLQDRLPAYMVPTSFLELASIPLTANGKINRKLLAQMDSRSIDSGDDYVQPTNDIEEQLVQIWSDLLKIPAENIGIQSNFFDLGGNSILAIKLLGTINKTFELQISLVDLYTEANIEKLAERIGGKKKELQEEEDQLDLLADTMETAFNKLINNEYE